jgi:hypothetical protein
MSFVDHVPAGAPAVPANGVPRVSGCAADVAETFIDDGVIARDALDVVASSTI